MRLHVGPHAVRGSLYAAWPSRIVLARAYRDFGAEPRAASDRNEATTNADFRSGAIDAVLSELKAFGPIRGAQLQVELANELTHLEIVRGDHGGASERQLRTIAVACMADLLGEAAPEHIVQWQLQRDLCHLLVCALEREVSDSLQFTASHHGLTLVSLQPALCSIWNRHAAALHGGSGVFGTTAGGYEVVARVTSGAITALSSGLRSDDKPAPERDVDDEPDPLDSRTDRLLSSAGADPLSISAFVLVSPEASPPRLSSRWIVLAAELEAA